MWSGRWHHHYWGIPQRLSAILFTISLVVAGAVVVSGTQTARSPSWYEPPSWSDGTFSTTAAASSSSSSSPSSLNYVEELKELSPAPAASLAPKHAETEKRVGDGSGDEKHGEHWHKPLFPLNFMDFLGFFLGSLGLMLAAGGGIGGGGMLVPLYVLVMGFTPKHAIPLSNVTVFGGACANFIMNRKKRHPTADRPLMDWDLILVMQPMTIAGALLGSFLNKLLPELLLTISLVLLLAFTTNATLRKGIEAYHKETAAALDAMNGGAKQRLLAQAANGQSAIMDRLLHNNEEGRVARAVLEDEEEDDDDDDDDDDLGTEVGGGLTKHEAAAKEASSDSYSSLPPPMFKDAPRGIGGGFDSAAALGASELELDGILREESVVPVWKVKVILAVFTVVITINLLKGGGNLRSVVGITCGSPGYWASTAFMFLWILAISYYVRTKLMASSAAKQRLNYKYAEGDIVWDDKATVYYPAICIIAGMCAGMFGIGGGIVQVPLMLHIGVNPKVASASSATMILFTSFTALTSFYVFGLLLEDYATVGFFIGLAVTFVGQFGLTMLIKKIGRDSLIVFSVAAVVGVSAVLMATHSVVSMLKSQPDLAFGAVCSEGEGHAH